jgi:hypothetical protein
MYPGPLSERSIVRSSTGTSVIPVASTAFCTTSIREFDAISILSSQPNTYTCTETDTYADSNSCTYPYTHTYTNSCTDTDSEENSIRNTYCGD